MAGVCACISTDYSIPVLPEQALRTGRGAAARRLVSAGRPAPAARCAPPAGRPSDATQI